MNTKNLIIMLIGVTIIGCAVYFAMSKRVSAPIAPLPITTQSNNQSTSSSSVAPSPQAATNDIIDYIVDGQSTDEMNTAKKTLEESSVSTPEPTINTNF